MKALPANRVVLILGIVVTACGGAGTYVAGVEHSLPQSWAPALTVGGVILGGIAGVTASVIKFLDGSQKSEALQARSGTIAGYTKMKRSELEGDQIASAASNLLLRGTTFAPEPAPQSDPAPEPVDVDQDRVDDGHWRPASALEPAPAEEEAKAA